MVVECGGRPVVYRVGRVQPALAGDEGMGWTHSEGPFSGSTLTVHAANLRL
jgi:hypothetical protein